MRFKIVLLLALLLHAVLGIGQNIPQPMEPRRIVNDYAKLFSPAQEKALEQKLTRFDDSTSSQITVVTLKSLDGYPAIDYAQRLGQKWGVGQKGKDNGIVILIKPKIGRERGEAAISVGYGLEGVIPDIIASRIVRNEMIPAFQRGNYYQGVDQAVTIIMDLSRGEYTANQYAKKQSGKGGFPIFILFPIFFFFILPLFVKRHRGYTTGSHGSAVPPFFIGGFGSSRSNYDSFSSGGGSFGGFGGFGGGSFGGGGAGGSW